MKCCSAARNIQPQNTHGANQLHRHCCIRPWASMKYPEAAPALMLWLTRATQVLSVCHADNLPTLATGISKNRPAIAHNTIERRSSSNCMISLLIPSPAAMASKHGSKVMPEPVVTRHCSPHGDVMPLWQTHGYKRHTAKGTATRHTSLA